MQLPASTYKADNGPSDQLNGYHFFVASLADIPDELLQRDQLHNFIQWVTSLPLDRYHKTHITSIWSRFTKVALQKDHWRRIQLPDQD